MFSRSNTARPATTVAVKICGITNMDDALACLDAGADMLGFNFYERSRRHISAEAASPILRAVRERGNAKCIGVFVDAPVEEIRDVARRLELDGVQLHGAETPAHCQALLPVRVIKALRVYAGFDPAIAAAFDCDAILLDTWSANEHGGTGVPFDWSVAAAVGRNVKRLILAGGLNARNVAEAIRIGRPDVVDVCSGVEDSARQKNSDAIREFVATVRSASAAADVPTTAITA